MKTWHSVIRGKIQRSGLVRGLHPPTQPGAAFKCLLHGQDDDLEEGEAEPGEMQSLKRPNPITWQTPPKKPRVADASDESPADSAGGRQGRDAGSMSASRAASSKQPQPSPAKGEPAFIGGSAAVNDSHACGAIVHHRMQVQSPQGPESCRPLCLQKSDLCDLTRATYLQVLHC